MLVLAPPRADVVKSLKNGSYYISKSLLPGYLSGSSPVLALDVFLVQASANTILSHFLGLVFSLELLRSVTLPPSETIPVPKAA
ncbi:Protein TIC 21, chloroplastic [Vitis vinifera]|uniref:Protein TIC 21, chloroplastic n=1 Tax=Vitis vinifera TaxID=29760 RepID=A0A438EPD0_VITVI|nr:Protein TIC 21, chloroplastic [Vitis vinifera]